MCVMARGQPRVFLSSDIHSPTVRQGLSLAWSSPIRLYRLVTMDPPGSTCLQHLGFTNACHQTQQFYVASGTEIVVIVLVRQILH